VKKLDEILNELVLEELEKNQNLKEEITGVDEDKIRDLIRSEVSAIFFDLFKKRKMWGA
jgi:hypothetical protein